MKTVALRGRVREYFGSLQDSICAALERVDGAAFREDRWRYAPDDGPGDGGGITRVLADGGVFEKAGVNLSAVEGRLSERLAARLKTEAQNFFATGVSLVLHPRSPMIPTAHMNVRYLELGEPGDVPQRAWFGGGADLTPYYLFDDDAAHFHRTLRDACGRHDASYYPRFKKWCDEYFHLSHRGEARGVGGVFFDYLDEDLERTFCFVRDVGDAFTEAYVPIVERRRDAEWGEAQRTWQEVRRGRYVEFNLVHDRGTLFGLETGGRTESILMSLPPVVRWSYDHRPEPGSREAELLERLREPIDWL
ncbi:MAG: oxygen-dependent coproporphyrinogen oxidase [bacterium]|nr:oxygen-dependent coproporphyrinogen oxidase [bacterium]